MVASFSSQVTLSTCGFSCRWPLKRNSTLSHKMCTTTPVRNSKTISLVAHFLFLRIDLHIFGGEGWVSGGGCVNTTDPVVRIVRLQCMFCSFLIIDSAHKCISNTTRLTSSISSTGSSGPVKNDNIITVTNTQMDNKLTKGSLNEQSYTSTTTI